MIVSDAIFIIYFGYDSFNSYRGSLYNNCWMEIGKAMGINTGFTYVARQGRYSVDKKVMNKKYIITLLIQFYPQLLFKDYLNTF